MTEVLERAVPRSAADESRAAANDGFAGDPRGYYLEGVGALCRRAVERGEMADCVWALTRWLAWVLFTHRAPAVAADVLGWLGRHLEEFSARERAEEELRALRQQGGRPS